MVPAVRPRDLDPYAYSHIVYSFAGVARGTWALTETQADDKELIAELQGLKKKNPTLKTMWAVGGWAFNVRFFHLFFDSGFYPDSKPSIFVFV